MLATHGDLAGELLASAEMICGSIGDAGAVGLHATDSPEAYAARLGAAIGDDSLPILILVDLEYGTPFNVASMITRRIQGAGRKVAVVTGVNLGILLEAVTSLEQIGAEAIAGLVAAGRASITGGVAPGSSVPAGASGTSGPARAGTD